MNSWFRFFDVTNRLLNIKSTYFNQAVDSVSLESEKTRQSDEKKSGDDSESIRFIPPNPKSKSNKVDQAKQQHQKVST